MGKIKKGTCMSTAESYQLLFNEKKRFIPRKLSINENEKTLDNIST